MAKTKITQKLNNGNGPEKRISVISKSASVANGTSGDLDRENLAKMKAQTDAAAQVFEEAAANWKAANEQILALRSMMLANGQLKTQKQSSEEAESQDESSQDSDSSENEDVIKEESPQKPQITIIPKEIGNIPQDLDDDGLPQIKTDKLPSNAYLYYVSRHFASLKAQYPTMTMKQINSNIAAMWRNMPRDEKTAFQEEFKAQQAKFKNRASKAKSSSQPSESKRPKIEPTNTSKEESSSDSSSGVSDQQESAPSEHPSQNDKMEVDDQHSNQEPRLNEGDEPDDDDDDDDEEEEEKEERPSTPTRGGPSDSVPWIFPIVGTPTSFGLSPHRKRKIRSNSSQF